MPLSNIFGKIMGFVQPQDDAKEDRQQQGACDMRQAAGRRDGVRSLLLDFRDHLVLAVESDSHIQLIVQGFVQLDVPLKEKFITLRVTELLKENSENIQGLKHIHSGLGTIIRYAKHLIKDNRREQWATISFKNSIVQKKILPMKGFPTVLHQLGYTEKTEFGQSFPAGKGPDKKAVVSLIADMELFLAELKTYCSGRHLHPESIGQYLPQHLRDELLERQVSMLSMTESTDNWSSSTPTLDSQDGFPDSQSLPGVNPGGATTNAEHNNNNNDEETVEAGPLTSSADTGTRTQSDPNTPVNQTSRPDIVNAHQTSAEDLPIKQKGEGVEVFTNAVGPAAGAADTAPVDEGTAIQDLVVTSESISESDITAASATPESASDTSVNSRLPCSVCGEEAVYVCRQCYDSQMALCETCNKSWHKRQDRRHHTPQPISRHHRFSLDSSSSGHGTVHIDEDYGIMASSRHKQGSQQQTAVVEVPQYDENLNVSAADHPVLRLRESLLPQDQQAGDFKLLDFQRQQLQHLSSVPSQLSPQSMGLQQSPPFQLGQQHFQGYNNQGLQPQQQNYNLYLQQHHQQMPASMSQVHRMPRPNVPHGTYPTRPSMQLSSATSTFPQQAEHTSMLMRPNVSSAGPRFVPLSLGGQYTVAGQPYSMYPHTATPAFGQPPRYPGAMMGNGQGGIHTHLLQQQEQRLPSYIQDQLEPSHQPPPRFANPVDQSLLYQQMIPPYQPHQQQQQVKPREQLGHPRHFGYPLDTPSSAFSTPPPPLYSGQQVRQLLPHTFEHLQRPKQPMFFSDPRQQLQQQQSVSMGQSLSTSNMNMPPQQGSVLHPSHSGLGMSMPRETLAHSNSTNTDISSNNPFVNNNDQTFLQNRNSNLAKMLGLGGENVAANYQKKNYQPGDLKRFSGLPDSSSVSPSPSPFMSAPSSPMSTPPPQQPSPSPSPSAASSSQGSEYIKKLLSEQDLMKRRSMCENFIHTISEDMNTLDKETERRMSEVNTSFYRTQECWDMQRRKEEMVKEKKKLADFKEGLDRQVTFFYRGTEGEDGGQTIYYPPDLDTGGPSKAVPPNLVDVKMSLNIGAQDKEKILNVTIDNSEHDTSPNHHHTSATPSPAHSSCEADHRPLRRVPVEDSIDDPKEHARDRTPPTLPPRSSKPVLDKNPLAMTIPAPKIPKSPSPPTSMWACSHCTLFNPMNVHICEVCHKTSYNALPVRVPTEEGETDKGYDSGSDLTDQRDAEGNEHDQDKFIATLAKLRDEVMPKKPNLLEDDDNNEDEDDDDLLGDNTNVNDQLSRNKNIGHLIMGSQKQVMAEKKRAKKEFEEKERERLQQETMSEISSPGRDSKNHEEIQSSSSPNQESTSATASSPSHPPPFGVGARPKNKNRVPVSIELTGEQSDSIEDSLARMDELNSIDNLQTSGAQLIRLVKMADLEDFDIQAVEIAMDVCENMKVKVDPLAWLRANWRKNVAKIAAQVRVLGQGQNPNNVGEVSFQEAEEAYISCQGNMKKAAERCVGNRHALYEKLSSLYKDVPREEILEAMLFSKGDAEAAETRMVKANLDAFQARVWQQQGSAVQTPEAADANPPPAAATVTATTTGIPTISTPTTPVNGSTFQGIMARLGSFVVSSSSRPPQLPGSGGGSRSSSSGSGSGGSQNAGSVTMAGSSAGAVDPYLSFATSVIGHQQFQDMMRDRALDFDRRVRMIYVEGRLHSWGRAELVVKILDQDVELQQDLTEGHVTLEDVVEAVRDCQDRASALAYLRQECQICFGRFPMNKIHNLNICQCRLCLECLVSHFEVAIREKHVRHWVCPQCAQPDMRDPEVASNYLQFLGMQLQPMITTDLRDLFETKFRDWHLQKMDYFRWCAHCAEGFLAENQGNQLRMTCPRCGKRTCFKCKKQWEDQHEGLTCEEFSQWRVDNDPTNQSVGLAKHLDENGIDCPNCKMRFALAKGGCMHFKCPQCGHEFCSGCNEAYHHKNMCTKYKLCKNLGLHCHCPRDCFSFLRDNTVEQLQTLLKQHSIAFNVAPPDDQLDGSHCPVLEQKEFAGDTKRDEKCGREAFEGGAGLCELHYKEYLVVMINNNSLDPVTLMTKDEMETLLGRYDLPVPAIRARITPEAYKSSLVKLIQEKLPLRKR